MEIKNKRVNIRMSEEIFNYYDDMAKNMGITRSSVMVMALKGYMDQQEGLKAMSTVQLLLDKVEKQERAILEQEQEQEK